MATNKDIALIGAGIMSATLGTMIKQLFPKANIHIFERLDRVAAESSDAWNNAGTGHSAFCELNYTPLRENNSCDISKAKDIAEKFEISKQFWAYLKEQNILPSVFSFINDLPHMSFVWGQDNIDFLKVRYQAMQSWSLFSDMTYSEDLDQIAEWVPLMMKGRKMEYPMAVTHMPLGTDVNFGALTRNMIDYLESSDNVEVSLGHEVRGIKKRKNGKWRILVKDLFNNEKHKLEFDYVFIGAGGGALPLLEKTNIPEAEGYGGFPVGGQFLCCTNPEVVNQHEAKVYGKAAVGSPPMSVPHLDTRILDGERSLLFGPYAGFSTKFLKNGSFLDLPLSIEMHNIWPMLSAGIYNVPLTKYLIKQVIQSPEERFKMLQMYYPEARMKDWKLITAGQRVQIIKGDKKKGGVLKFGTEIVSSSDKTLCALLGASPGASTSVSIMLEVLEIMMASEMDNAHVQNQLKQLIPSYGQSLCDNPALCHATRERTTAILKLTDGPMR